MTVPQAEIAHVIVDPAQVCAAYARHRRRFAAEVAALEAEALATPSRCTEWTVADVLRHLTDVDGWMRAIWSGQPLPFTDFDPNVTPNEFVAAARSVPDLEVRDRYRASAEELAKNVGASDPDRWGLPSLSPLGLVPWWLSAMHVFWDSWVHERDALMPLGIDVPTESDELEPVLSYALVVAGTLIREPTDTVVGGVRLTADRGVPAQAQPVEHVEPDDQARLVDALTGRSPLTDGLPTVDADMVERLGSLARFLNP